MIDPVLPPSLGGIIRDLGRRISSLERKGGPVFVTSPNGTKYRITVSDAGALSATAV